MNRHVPSPADRREERQQNHSTLHPTRFWPPLCQPPCTYTPANNYQGADSFTYTLSNGNGGSATATVYLTISDQLFVSGPGGTGRAWGTFLRIPLAAFLAPISGGSTPYSLLTVSSPEAQDYVSISGSYVLFAPVGNTSTTLTYTVQDSSSTPLQTNNTFAVTVTNAFSAVNAISSSGGAAVSITFAGVRGYKYVVERSGSATDWTGAQVVQTVELNNGTGLWNYTAPSPPSPSFYRSRQNN